MKDFLYDWKKKAKKWDKEQRAENLYSHLGKITEFFLKRSHNAKFRDQLNDILDVMATKQFSKAIKTIVSNKKDYPVHLSLATIITTVLERRYDKLEEESREIMQSAVEKILKKRAKEVSKETGIDQSIATDLLIAVPEPESVHDTKFIGIYVRNVLRRIYANSENDLNGLDSSKKFREVMASLFGKENLPLVAVATLLERKDTVRKFNPTQLEAWNHLTKFSLDVIEKLKKKEIQELLVERYVERRKDEAEKGNDNSRRIQLTTVTEEDHPRIHAAVAKLSEKEKYKKYL